MGNFETSLAYGEIPKKIFRELGNISESVNGDFKHERMFGRVAIHIANTINWLVEMDFVDYGDFSKFLRILNTFPCISEIISTVGWGQTSEMWREKAFSIW